MGLSQVSVDHIVALWRSHLGVWLFTTDPVVLCLQDARALSSCEQLLRTVGLSDEDAQPDQLGENALIAAGRRVLWKLIHEAVRAPPRSTSVTAACLQASAACRVPSVAAMCPLCAQSRGC